MAREIYAFDVGEFRNYPSDVRLAHHHLRAAIEARHPFLGTTKETWTFSYVIVGMHADGQRNDYQVFVHVENQRDATLIKTFLP